MDFSELIKKGVRRKSGYTCCVCRVNSISVEAHHIVPKKENGPNTFDNAAPLCPSCHENFGGNPGKRSRIREMRDSWYETVEKMYKPRDLALIETISNDLADIQDKKSPKGDFLLADTFIS